MNTGLLFFVAAGVAVGAQLTFWRFAKKGIVPNKATKKGLLVLSVGFAVLLVVSIDLIPLLVWYLSQNATGSTAINVVTFMIVSKCLHFPAAFIGSIITTWWTIRTVLKKKYGG